LIENDHSKMEKFSPFYFLYPYTKIMLGVSVRLWKGNLDMEQEYWVSEWAIRRKDEVVPLVKDYQIHSDFLKQADKKELQTAFAEIHNLYMNIYEDIAQSPDSYGMPLHSMAENRIYSSEWRDSSQAPYRPFILLYNLLTCGDIEKDAVNVSVEKFKNLKVPPIYLTGIDQKVKRAPLLFSKLTEFGFVFEGLKNNKPSGNNIMLIYPDNTTVLYLLKLMADKARVTDRIADFLCCHFRLLQDDMKAADYGSGIDVVADRVHTDAEKDFCYRLDNALTQNGFCSKPYRGIECYGITYYRNEKLMNSKAPYSFRLVTRDFDFNCSNDEPERIRLLLRIRNVSNCMEYLKTCPDSVNFIFTAYSNPGCGKHANNTCKHGVGYEIDGKQYWRCACCEAPFKFKPQVEDIPHYIKLMELGEKR